MEFCAIYTVKNFWAPFSVLEALHSAVYDNNKEMVELLITNGADVNKANNDGWTPLYCAVWNNRKEIAELLIAKGADVNKATINSRTPLHSAVYNNSKEIVELLLLHGADVNKVDDKGKTLLQIAEEKKYIDIVAILEEYIKKQQSQQNQPNIMQESPKGNESNVFEVDVPYKNIVLKFKGDQQQFKNFLQSLNF